MTTYYSNEDRLLVAVDTIILGFQDNKLKILLGKRKREPGAGEWSLYGGFVGKEENLKDAAQRVLYELTGIKNVFMQQIGAFGKIHRDPGDRVISIAYCALINVKDYDKSLLDRYGLMWVDVDKRPQLFGDHQEMMDLALTRLRKQILIEPVGINLLPDLFTLTQLQHVYEAVLNRELDKRNFRKRLKQLDFVEKTELIDKTSSKRGAFLYRFHKKSSVGK